MSKRFRAGYRSTTTTVLFGSIAAFSAAAIPTQAQDGYFLQSDGKVVMEVEHAPPAGDWNAETNHAGFTGSAFYAWRGPNHYNDPGNGILEYPFMIVEGGTHYLKIHNRRDKEGTNVANDKYNDIWVRMDDGPWKKVFTDHLPWSEWNWTTKFDIHDVWPPATYNLGAGLHVMQISGRSERFKIDRIQLTLNSNETPSTSEPESEWVDDGSGPAPEVAGLTLVDADTDTDIRAIGDGATIDLQADGTALNIRADPVDTVGSMEFFLNGVSVKMENIAPYALGGDVAGDYDTFNFEVGTHTLTVVPYSGSDGSGTEGDPFTIGFTVTDSGACGADTDGNGTVDIEDLLKVLGEWGTCTGACDGDTTGDGTVNIEDLLHVLGEWGPCA